MRSDWIEKMAGYFKEADHDGDGLLVAREIWYKI